MTDALTGEHLVPDPSLAGPLVLTSWVLVASSRRETGKVGLVCQSVCLKGRFFFWAQET